MQNGDQRINHIERETMTPLTLRPSTTGTLFVGCLARKNLLNSPEFSDFMANLHSMAGCYVSMTIPICFKNAPGTYMDESGFDLASTMLTLAGTAPLHELIFLKECCMALESYYSVADRRQFNINPGFVTASSMVLASHKSSPIRKLLGRNVWIEEQFSVNAQGVLSPLVNAFEEYLYPSRIKWLQTLSKDWSFVNIQNASIPRQPTLRQLGNVLAEAV